MRINTNVSAINTLRTLGKTNTALSRSIGRLSSGYQINRAADDAAGLGIANKLRADVRSLKQASRNAEQATALLQVAEGATQVIAGIVDRMKELAAQSASSNSGSRATLQAEFNTLRTEIARIVDTTKYQGNTLLNGSMGNEIDAATGTLDDNALVQASTIQINGTLAGTYTIDAVDATHMSIADADGNVQVVQVATTGEQTVNFDRFGVSFRTATAFDITDPTDWTASTVVVAAGTSAASFLVSASGDYSGQDLVNVSTSMDLTTTALGIDASDISTQSGAQAALAALDGAIDTINSALATIGATQNRIDFAFDNVKTTIENYSAAESTIRDADMAAEMSEFTKNQILQQAGTAMLAQANVASQSVLKLLG